MDRHVKPLATIRHLIETERKKQQQIPVILRAGLFRWQKSSKSITDRKEERSLNSMPAMDDITEEVDDSDEFSDALSHTENCSLSMVSDINTADDEGSDNAEEETRRFIMNRFLPAATAMASESAHDQEICEKRSPAPVKGSGGPLPRQSRPYLMRRGVSDSSDDDDDDDVQLKVACGGFLCWSLKKNAVGLARTNPLCFLSPRRKGKKRVTCVNKDEYQTSSGTDEEQRAVITATKRKAWEARYRQQKLMTCSPLTVSNSREFKSPPEIGGALLSRISYNDLDRRQQSPSPLRKPNWESSPTSRRREISPYRNEAPISPFNQEGKGFLGFPSDRHPKTTYTNVKHSFQNPREMEQEENYYSGHSSPHNSSSDSATAAAAPGSRSSTSKKSFFDSDGVNTSSELASSNNNKIEGRGCVNSPVSVLPPPLPKSPSESWLCRAIPLLNNNHTSSTQNQAGVGKATMRISREEFDDAKWEI